MTKVRVMSPVPISTSMLGAGTTLAEPATAFGEIAWVSGGSYAVDDLRTYAGSVYSAVKASTGRTVTPDLDDAYWLRKDPSLRMSPFDDYASTTARATGTLTYVLSPGFVDGVSLYGLSGAAYSITVKDAPGGTVTASKSGDLYAQAAGLDELLFSLLAPVDNVALDGIPLSPTAEITITVTNGASGAVRIGDIKVGTWRYLIGSASDFGGVEYGAEGERKTYTSRTYNADGTYTTVRRGSYRDVRCSVVIDPERAMYADAVLAEVQDVAVPFQGSGLERYGFLSTMGFVSGSIRADSFGITRINLTIKGNI